MHPPSYVDDDPPMLCSHIAGLHRVRPTGTGCAGCIATGDAWLQLRMCMECGYVGCCDSSKNKHAVLHFRATQHPLARSAEPGEEWGWCYIDRLWFEKLIAP